LDGKLIGKDPRPMLDDVFMVFSPAKRIKKFLKPTKRYRAEEEAEPGRSHDN
jgi:hypothetical protein